MPLKTEALVTVDADQLVTMNIGYETINPHGTVSVKLPAHVAKELADLGAVTVTTPAVSTL